MGKAAGNRLRHCRAIEILFGQAARVMRRVTEDDALIVDLDVGMMIGVFGTRHERADKQHGFWKIGEGELLSNRLAVERPSVEGLEGGGDFVGFEERHSVGCYSLPTRAGSRSRNAGSAARPTTRSRTS